LTLAWLTVPPAAALLQVQEYIVQHGIVRVCKVHKILGLFELRVSDCSSYTMVTQVRQRFSMRLFEAAR
jgi:hypothetical protein